MTLFALGINHTTATVDIREHLAFSSEDIDRALVDAKQDGVATEIALLSTCNRTEIYCDTSKTIEELIDWLAGYKQLNANELSRVAYMHQEAEAARHMMSVACGLDSLVLGEPQILGQMKTCYAQAMTRESVGTRLHATFQNVFAVAKRVRSDTRIGENPVSVAYAAVSLAQQIFSDLRQDTALLVGAGETIELVARHMRQQGLKHILVANRTVENAQRLADEFSGEALSLSSIPDVLPRADIVVSSTASPLPIIGKGTVEQALKKRKHKPMFMVDIAVPRDIESQVGDLNDVFLYTVDDLKEVIDENKKSRQQAADIAHDIIDEGLRQYVIDQKALTSVDTIRRFRTQISLIADAELNKAKKQMQAGADPELVLSRFAATLSNKFMHAPTTSLKKAGENNELEVISIAQKIFNLDVD